MSFTVSVDRVRKKSLALLGSSVQHKKVALFSYRFSYKDFGLCSCIGKTKWFYNQ